MSMTKNKKWSRLLFTLLIVVAIGLTMLPAAVFAAPCELDDPSPCGPLQVTIVKPDPGTEVTPGQFFWVNAAVARPYGAGTIENVYATINKISGDATIVDPVTQGPYTLNNCDEVIDFWWKVKCEGPADFVFNVSATGTPLNVPTNPSQNCGTFSGTSATRTVYQADTVCDPCIVVEIIECGPEDVQGAPLPAYPDETVYAVKALLHNICDVMICDVVAHIDWTPVGGAEILSGSQDISVGCIFPNRAEEVGWTFICRSGEDVTFTVGGSCYKAPDPLPPPNCDPCDPRYIPDPCSGICVVAPDSCVVDQICPADLGVEIIEIPEQVCYGCGSSFDVTALVCELCGETGLNNVRAEISWTGPAVLAGGADPVQNICDYLDPGDCAPVTWTFDCTGEGDVEIYVYVRGTDQYNNELRQLTIGPFTVQQWDTLSVQPLGPADYTVYNVCEEFEASWTLTNCTGADINDTVYAGICLTNAPNVAVVGTTNSTPDAPSGAYATITPCPTPGAPDPVPYQAPLINKGESCYYIPIDCICSCCYVTITVPLQCVGSGVTDCGTPMDEVIQIYSGLVPGQWLDNDTIIVRQMYKAHLTANLEVYEGLVAEGNFEGYEPICAVVPGESFTVVAAVANQGEAKAQDVTLNIGWTGPATLLDTPEEQNIGDIGCKSADKAIWEFTCTGEGPVTFFLDSITGNDVNYEGPIHADNIETACPIRLQQIPFGVTIIQPITSTDFLAYECFTVKARVTNLSTMYTLDNVLATLRWDSEGEGCDPCGDFELSTPVSIDVTPGDDKLIPGESALVTWQVCCCSPGDVSFWIDVDAVTVFDNVPNPSIPGGCTLDISSDVNTIHQWEKGGIFCYILSPKLQDFDICHEYGDPEAYIATGQEFAVTAKLVNTGDLPFSVDNIDLFAMGWGYMGDIEVIGTSFGDLTQNPILLAPFGEEGDSIVISFDCVCTEPGKTDILMSVEGESVPPDGSAGVRNSCMSFVCIYQYSAAHLVVTITSIPDPIEVGSEFPVLVNVQNIGDADAWEVQAQLSVYPAGSAGVSSNDQYGSYTRYLGNIIGHTVNETEEAEWLLRCNAEGDTTITVTATGYDEFGYEVKQICTSEIVPPPIGPFQATCCELLLDGTPGAPIQSRFIDSDSITVLQGEESSNGEGGDNFNLTLYSGWNLVSSPWFLSETNPAVVFADAIPGVIRIYAYDRAAQDWKIWNADGGPGELDAFRDGPGYWVLMDDLAEPLTISILDGAPGGTWIPPTYTVSQTGWDLVGPRIGEPPSTTTATQWLSPLSFALALGYNAQTGAYFTVNPGDNVQPGQGYWVAFTSTGDRYR